MKNVPENELFSAYLDGELTADEQAQIERLLATSPAARQLMDELRALSSTLQALPQHKLDEDLSERVLRLAERRMLSEPVSPESRHDLPSPHRIPWRPILRRVFKPRNLLWPALAVAVAIFLMMTDSGRFPPADHREVVLAPETADEATGTSGPAVLGEALEGLAEAEESAESPPETFYKDGPLDALVERGGRAGEVAAPVQPVAPEPEDLAGFVDGPAIAPGSPQVPKAPMPELPIAGKPPAMPGMGKTLSPGPGTAGSGGAGGGPRPAVQPVTEPGSRAGGVQGRDSDPAKPDLPPSGSGGAVLGSRPAPVAPPAVPPGEQQPLREPLVVRCNISAEAARGRVFDQVLSLQRVSRAKADARGTQDDRYFYSRGLLENQDAAERSGAKAERLAEQIQFDVEATPAQLRAIVADLKSRPDEFSFVSDLSPLGIPASRPRSFNGREGLAVDERFGVHRFGGAEAARGRAVAEGESRSGRRELKHGEVDPAGPDAGYEPKGLGTYDAAEPGTSPESPAEAAPREVEAAPPPEGKPAAEPEPAGAFQHLGQPSVPSDEPAPAGAAEQVDEEERVTGQPLKTPDARGVPVVEQPPRPSPPMPARSHQQKPKAEADEPDEEQAVLSDALPSEPRAPGEPRDKNEEPSDSFDRGEEKYLVRFVFQVVRPDIPVAGDVVGRPAASPAAAMEREAAAEVMEPPAAEMAPAAAPPAEAAPAIE